MLEVKLLGQFDVRSGGTRVNIPTLPARFLLAYLLLNRDFPQSREKLAALFWPDSSDSNARTSLRQALWRIRKALEVHQGAGAPILAADETSIGITPEAVIWLDTVILSQTAESIADLQRTLAVYEGELLPDCYDDWAVVEREYYQSLFAQKMRLLLNLLVEAQRWSDVVSWAERWITLAQAPEPAYRALMRAHAGLGDVSRVAIDYRRCQEALWRELGVEPSEHTTALRDRLVKGESSLTRGYDLRELVSRSDTGEVYRAYQPLLNREVAVKVIAPRHANSPDFIRRFETRAQLIARLEHIHIRPLYDYWRDPDGAYLVMRWLDGGNLGQRLRQNTFMLPAVIRLLQQSASALSAAHQRGVVHGNLKPDNILFDEEGNAYLTDFPIGLVMGTVPGRMNVNPGYQYAAPEQIEGEPPTALSDQYSLALILHEVLTGAFPNGEGADAPARHEAVAVATGPLPDLPPEISHVLDRALAEEPGDRFPDVLTLADTLQRVLAAELPRDNSNGFQPKPNVEVANPYKGLRAFQEADAADFFGRDALVKRILARLEETVDAGRFLALVGPSGSGKSSVIHAGLIPALRQGALPRSESWYVVDYSPGTQPLADLEVDLLHIAAHQPAELEQHLRKDEQGLLSAVSQILPDPKSELLLIIDHFEELFTLVEDRSEIDHFLNILSAAVLDADSTLRIIISLRADYYDRPLIHRTFGDIVRRRTEVVIPMSADELWQSIVLPAENAGLTVEPGLPTTIVSEVMERPSALPLLQYALTELFEQREGSTLTRNAYEAIGGVGRALVRRAEVVYSGLNRQEQAAAKQLFLRLVNPAVGGEETLRRVLLSELVSLSASSLMVAADSPQQGGDWSLDSAGIPTDYSDTYEKAQFDPGVIKTVIQVFGRSRLLTFDHDPASREPTVEVAHDALLREWKRLQFWLEDNRSDLRMQYLLSTVTKEWLDADRDPSYLLRGKRLDQLQLWVASTTFVLNQEEEAFIAASMAARQRQLDEALNQQQREQALLKQRRQRNAIFVGAGTISLLFILLATVLFTVARDRARVALSGQLATKCLDSRREHYDLALLLCLEAGRFADTFEARDALATLYTENPQQSYTLRGHQSAVTTLAFSEHDTRLASSGADGSVFLWDPAAGQRIEALESGSVNAYQGGSSPSANAAEVVVGAIGAGYDGWVSSARDDQAALQLTAADGTYKLPGFVDRATSLAISSDGETLAAGIADGRILLWDIASQRLAGDELDGHHGAVVALAFSPDGTTLASGGQDNSVLVWDIMTGKSSRLVDHGSSPLAVQFSPDGHYLASSSANGSILLTDLTASPVTNRLLGFGNRAEALAFSPAGTQLAVGFIDGTISLWDPSTGLPIVQRITGHNGAVKALAYSRDGQVLASGSDDRNIVLRTIAAGPTAHSEGVTGVSYRPGGSDLVTSSRDGTVRFWNQDLQNTVVPPFRGQSEGVNDVVVSPDGRMVATAGRDGTIALLDAETGQEIKRLAGHEAFVTSLAFSPDGRRLASGSADNSVILWDVRSGEPVGPRLKGHSDWVFAVAYAPDGRRLASGGRDNRIILWDVETGSQIGEALEGHENWVYSLAFSSDGRWLASGGADNLAYLWDLKATPITGSPLAGHTGYVFDVSFSRDNELLFTGAAGGALSAWDVKSGRPIGQPLAAHQGGVYSMDISPDGKWLATGGQDAAVRFWRTDLREWACEAVGRNLTRAEWEGAVQGELAPINLLLDLTYHKTCAQWPSET